MFRTPPMQPAVWPPSNRARQAEVEAGMDADIDSSNDETFGVSNEEILETYAKQSAQGQSPYMSSPPGYADGPPTARVARPRVFAASPVYSPLQHHLSPLVHPLRSAPMPIKILPRSPLLSASLTPQQHARDWTAPFQLDASTEPTQSTWSSPLQSLSDFTWTPRSAARSLPRSPLVGSFSPHGTIFSTMASPVGATAHEQDRHLPREHDRAAAHEVEDAQHAAVNDQRNESIVRQVLFDSDEEDQASQPRAADGARRAAQPTPSGTTQRRTIQGQKTLDMAAAASVRQRTPAQNASSASQVRRAGKEGVSSPQTARPLMKYRVKAPQDTPGARRSDTATPSARTSKQETPKPKQAPTNSNVGSSSSNSNSSNSSNNNNNNNADGSKGSERALSPLYKTELCRSFSETGYCRYGGKCQFAHGVHDLRPVVRHKKYKTEKCKNFERDGVCPYGPRCRFIHNEDAATLSVVKAMAVASLEGSAHSDVSKATTRTANSATPLGSVAADAASGKRLPIFALITTPKPSFSASPSL